MIIQQEQQITIVTKTGHQMYAVSNGAFHVGSVYREEGKWHVCRVGSQMKLIPSLHTYKTRQLAVEALVDATKDEVAEFRQRVADFLASKNK